MLGMLLTTSLWLVSAYNAGNVGSNTCSSGFTLIDNLQQCSAVARRIGATFYNNYYGDWPAYPKGCMITADAGEMFFNHAAVGAAHTYFAPVCIIPQPCNASAAPAHGRVGTCTSHLPVGATCQPTCEEGLSISWPTTCSATGFLTAAKCIASGKHRGTK